MKEELLAMREHSINNPKHGYNCACKDEFIRLIRRWVKETDTLDDLIYVTECLIRSI